MASIFKLGRDKSKKRAHWYYQFVDHTGKKQMRKGFTDKALTEQAAAKAEHEARLRKTGLIDPLSEQISDQQKSSIEKHLEDYEMSLLTKGTTRKHVTLVIGRIRCIVAGCTFKTLASINADRVESFMSSLRTKKDLGPRSYNHYLQAFESFCNWLVSRRRVRENPVRGIPRLNQQVDIRHARRSLTQEEFRKLVQSARESDELIQCFDGETRARIYLLSYMTGLRRGELASLTPDSFNLDSDPPTVTVEASCSKHRRKDVLPLHPELVKSLIEWLPSAGPLFPQLGKRRTWLMVKKDLERAGIPYRTSQGVADFHAAGRHTYITELLRNGASLPEARQLARHSDVNMTMRYTHIGLPDQAQAIKRLPCQHIVSNSAGSGCHSSSSDDTADLSKNDRTPDEIRGSVAGCQRLSGTDFMEAAGIEPASCEALG